MLKQYSLAYLTVSGCAPAEMVYIADRTGYDFVSLRLMPMGIPGEAPFSPEDKEQVSKVRKALEETDVKLFDYSSYLHCLEQMCDYLVFSIHMYPLRLP